MVIESAAVANSQSQRCQLLYRF